MGLRGSSGGGGSGVDKFLLVAYPNWVLAVNGTRYLSMPNGNHASESVVLGMFDVAIKINSLGLLIRSNSKATSSSLTLRKNGADQSFVLTYGAGIVGAVIHDSDEVEYDAGDNYTIKYVGTEALLNTISGASLSGEFL